MPRKKSPSRMKVSKKVPGDLPWQPTLCPTSHLDTAMAMGTVQEVHHQKGMRAEEHRVWQAAHLHEGLPLLPCEDVTGKTLGFEPSRRTEQ